MADGSAPPGDPVGSDDGMARRTTDAAQAPATILGGKYRIERVIGQGAFGRVYLAFDPLLRRNVAVKELLATREQTDQATYERYLERFQREARAAGGLAHPNIVTVHELAVDSDRNYYLVMQYVDGADLRDLLTTVGTLPAERAVAIALEVAHALEAIHEQDIVHRDLKPANIMLTRRGVAKVTDFGIAQVGHESHRTQMTIGHPGTPIYMSPEQAASAEYLDGRSDLFSLGLILYEMLIGEPYVRRRQPLATVRVGLSPLLVQTVERLMERDPDARYQTAADAVAALHALSTMPVAESDAAPTLLPDTGPTPLPTLVEGISRLRTDDAVPGVPAAYGGPPSEPPPGTPAITPPPPRADDTKRRAPRGRAFWFVGGALALVIAFAGVAAYLVVQPGGTATATFPSSAAARPTSATLSSPTNDAAATLPPSTGTRSASATLSPPTSNAAVNFSTWTVEETKTYRASYDRAASEYHLALLLDSGGWTVSAPDLQTTADFTLDVDVRRVAGPDFGEYGVAFRSQQPVAGDPNNLRYAFRINSMGQYTLLQINADNSNTTIQSLTTSPAIKKGGVPNHLTVICKGETVTLAVNGTTLGMWKVALVKPGTVGVIANSPSRGGAGLEGAFKNLQISPAT